MFIIQIKFQDSSQVSNIAFYWLPTSWLRSQSSSLAGVAPIIVPRWLNCQNGSCPVGRSVWVCRSFWMISIGIKIKSYCGNCWWCRGPHSPARMVRVTKRETMIYFANIHDANLALKKQIKLVEKHEIRWRATHTCSKRRGVGYSRVDRRIWVNYNKFDLLLHYYLSFNISDSLNFWLLGPHFTPSRFED